MAKKRSLYDTYSDKKLNAPICVVSALWIILAFAYGNIMVGLPIGLMGGVPGVVALIVMYNARKPVVRFGVVAVMAVISLVVVLYTQQQVEQEHLASQPDAAQVEVYQQLQGQELAVKSVTLRQPAQTTGQAELKEQLPNSLNYPLVELKKVDGTWYVGCKTIEGQVLWLKDVYRLFQDFNALGRCPAGLSVSIYAER